jgi:hypothetical protein
MSSTHHCLDWAYPDSPGQYLPPQLAHWVTCIGERFSFIQVNLNIHVAGNYNHIDQRWWPYTHKQSNKKPPTSVVSSTHHCLDLAERDSPWLSLPSQPAHFGDLYWYNTFILQVAIILMGKVITMIHVILRDYGHMDRFSWIMSSSPASTLGSPVLLKQSHLYRLI